MAQQQPTEAQTHPAAAEQPLDKAALKAQQLADAQRYRQEAEQYEKQAAKHEREAAEYRRRAPAAPKGANFPEIARHCDRLAQNLKAAAAQARDMEYLHTEAAKVFGN